MPAAECVVSAYADPPSAGLVGPADRCCATSKAVHWTASDHHQVDVAGRGVGVLRDRAVDEGRDELLRERTEHLAQRFGQAERLVHDAPQFLEDGRVGIGLVVLLVADRSQGDEPAASERGQLALHRARAHASQADQLVCVEAPRRLAEQQREDALLCSREERIGEVGGGGYALLDRTHFGHKCTQIGLRCSVFRSSSKWLVRTAITTTNFGVQ